MFSSYKNSYLQLVCAVNPRLLNKAVDYALRKPYSDSHDALPPAQRLESMQPSLYAPHVDISRAKIGFGVTGLRVLVRQLHSEDHLVQLQALHSVLDEVQITEHAMVLINLHIAYRLINLMLNPDPVIKEKICMILTHLASYYQGRKQIMSRPIIIENLMWLMMRERKEIRYAAAYTLRTLARDRCACEILIENEKIVDNLLKTIKNDHKGIILLHLKTLTNLAEWDPVIPLKSNAFRIMLVLFDDFDPRIVAGAMDCMTQLCKHDVGKILADENDLVFKLKKYLTSKHIEIIISAVCLLNYTTLTTRSKWRAKECCYELTRLLVNLCHVPNLPPLQINAMHVLINLCDCPDVRYHLKKYWENKIKAIRIRTDEQWDGTSETTSYGFETGHNYRTMCIEGVETIKNDGGNDLECLNVSSYLRRVCEVKEKLIRAINWKCYID
uniref:Uncharacterized protein n=1 Tax=Bombyx mori TaxID=7091 RepID=A0A8R2ARY2_BOMMO|nr:uncharacterized protein LOC101744327 [Bombyx mori]